MSAGQFVKVALSSLPVMSATSSGACSRFSRVLRSLHYSGESFQVPMPAINSTCAWTCASIETTTPLSAIRTMETISLRPGSTQSKLCPQVGLAVKNWVDQSIAGLTSVLSVSRVNDLRFSYFFETSAEAPAGAANCSSCFGLGAPLINIADARNEVWNGVDEFFCRAPLRPN